VQDASHSAGRSGSHRSMSASTTRISTALEQPETRTEASEALRGLIDAIVLTPNQGELQIELKGNLAAMLGAATNAKRSPETGDLSLQVVMVAGAGFEPATFGL
jgi:site-specific DNA recombinase